LYYFEWGGRGSKTLRKIYSGGFGKGIGIVKEKGEVMIYVGK
jgi:hypothetical protein